MFTDSHLFSSTVSQQAILGAILDKLPDLVFVFDVSEQKLVFCNPSLLKELNKYNLLGDNMNCDSLRSFIHPDDWQKVLNALHNVTFQINDNAIEIEIRCKNELKAYQYYQIKLSVFEKKGDDVVQILGISRNITERVNNDAQREMYKNRLQDLSFITSHEMRHEYAKIQSIINLFDNKFITDAERIDLIKEAKKSIQIINSSIFKLNHKLSFNQNDDFYNIYNEGGHFKKIVFIDDDVLTNVLNKKIVQALLPEMPVEIFLEIEDAINALQKTDLVQTLIFLDINFPGKGGWDFLNEYTSFSNAANIIVLSSSIDNRDREKARCYKSVIDYITKPLSFEFIKTFFEELQSKNS